LDLRVECDKEDDAERKHRREHRQHHDGGGPHVGLATGDVVGD
jgi:hypothetical protein